MVGTYAEVGIFLLFFTMPNPTSALVSHSFRNFGRMKTQLTIALATDSRSLQRQRSFYQGRDPPTFSPGRITGIDSSSNFNELSSREQMLRQTNFSVLSHATR